jgi:hypothetical protein
MRGGWHRKHLRRQPPHRTCSPASVRTGPAGIQVRVCVDVRAHTREAREPRASRSCDPFRLPSLLLVLPLSFGQLAKNLPPTVRPHKLWPCFQVPTDSQGLWGVHEQYLCLNDPWEPGHAV